MKASQQILGQNPPISLTVPQGSQPDFASFSIGNLEPEIWV